MFMGILDFFRRKKVSKPESKEIEFDEIENWLEDKTKGINKKEGEVFDLIRGKIDLFMGEIGKKTKVLEAVDVESKKVEDRVKIIVRQSLDKYLNFVSIFIKELDEIEKQNLCQFIDELNKIFSEFDKHSYVFYKRATYLIGDEIAAVKQEINNLSEYFTKLFKESEEIVKSLKAVFSIKLKLRKIDELVASIDKINSEVKVLDERIKNKKDKVEEILEEIGKIKTSKGYRENLKKHEEIKLTEKQLGEDVLKLKSLVDFKALSNVFHSDEKKMKIIKSYKEDFQEGLSKNDGESILGLISEAELYSDIISDKIKQINEKKQNLVEIKKLIKKDKIKVLSEEVEKVEKEIEDLKIEKVKHVKRGEVIEVSRGGIVGEVMEGVGGFGVRLKSEF